jgi:hypothetical protein
MDVSHLCTKHEENVLMFCTSSISNREHVAGRLSATTTPSPLPSIPLQLHNDPSGQFNLFLLYVAFSLKLSIKLLSSAAVPITRVCAWDTEVALWSQKFSSGDMILLKYVLLFLN